MGSKDSMRRKLKAEVANYLEHQKGLSQVLFPKRVDGPDRPTVDDMVAAALRATEVETAYGVPNATWVRRAPAGGFEVIFAPVCPPGFKSIDEVIAEEAAANPKVARYLKSAQDYIDTLEEKEGRKGPGFLRKTMTND